MSATPDIATIRRHPRAQERANRREAAPHARRALACIRRKRFFLAVAELIKSEAARGEAVAVKRERESAQRAVRDRTPRIPPDFLRRQLERASVPGSRRCACHGAEKPDCCRSPMEDAESH